AIVRLDARGHEFVPDGKRNNGHLGTKPVVSCGARVESGDIDYDDSTVVPLDIQVLTGESVKTSAEFDPLCRLATRWRVLLRPRGCYRSGRSGRSGRRRWDDCRRGRRRRGRRGRSGLREGKGQGGGVTTAQSDNDDFVRLRALKAEERDVAAGAKRALDVSLR